jgi:hypothetical protein
MTVFLLLGMLYLGYENNHSGGNEQNYPTSQTRNVSTRRRLQLAQGIAATERIENRPRELISNQGDSNHENIEEQN